MTGVKSGTFTIPTTGHDFSGNTRYRITLTVTDSSGLTDTKSVIIWPTKVNLTFDTAPTGPDPLPRRHREDRHRSSTTRWSASTTPSRRATRRPAPTNYTFASWSDGGAQQHTIVVPAAATDATPRPTTRARRRATPAFVQVAQRDAADSRRAPVAVDLHRRADGREHRISWPSAGTTPPRPSPRSPTAPATPISSRPRSRVAPASARRSTTPRTSRPLPRPAPTPSRSPSPARAPFVDLRIAEYRGSTRSTRSTQRPRARHERTAASSGNVTTTSANELLFGAGMTTGRLHRRRPGHHDPHHHADRRRHRHRPQRHRGRDLQRRGHPERSAGWVMQVAAFRAAGPVAHRTSTRSITSELWNEMEAGAEGSASDEASQ